MTALSSRRFGLARKSKEMSAFTRMGVALSFGSLSGLKKKDIENEDK